MAHALRSGHGRRSDALSLAAWVMLACACIQPAPLRAQDSAEPKASEPATAAEPEPLRQLPRTAAALDAALKAVNPESNGKAKVTLHDGHIIAVDLTTMGPIQSVLPLRGLPLSRLRLGSDIQESPLTDLSPLKGMQLERLDLTNCPALRDLSVIRGMPLRHLRLNRMPVDLRQVRGLPPVETLEIRNSKIIDLSPLKGMQLTTLRLIDVTPVADITPLEGMPLKALHLVNTHVIDLRPLARMKLATLCIAGSKATDLSPLNGMPLKRLGIEQSRVRDLRPIAALPLELLTFTPKNIQTGLDVLRNMRTLKRVGLDFNAPAECMDLETFWKRFHLGEFTDE